MAAPDITGFVNAQANLRRGTGAQITFKVPVVPTWPGGTKINPITGEPYDSLAKRTNSGWTDVVKTCGIILKQGSPLRPQSDTEIVALGEMSGMDIILDLAESDYPDVEGAKEMSVHGLDYSIREFKPFGLGSVIYRRLVYGEQK